jgi:hypothetical protein
MTIQDEIPNLACEIPKEYIIRRNISSGYLFCERNTVKRGRLEQGTTNEQMKYWAYMAIPL